MKKRLFSILLVIAMMPTFMNLALPARADAANDDYQISAVNKDSTSSGAPVITSAKIGSTDIFTTKLEIKKDSTENYEVGVAVNNSGCTDVHIYISNDKKKKIEIENGKKSIQIGKEFSAGEPIYITAVDKKTGKSSSKRTTINVKDNGAAVDTLKDGNVNILNNFNYTVPKNVPVIGNQSLSFNLGAINASYEVDGNNFKASLGSEAMTKKRGKDGKWKREDWAGYKQSFKDAKDGKKASRAKYAKTYGSKTKLQIKKGMDGSIDASGYLEGTIDDKGMHITEGGIILTGMLKFSFKGMTVVVVVPVYYEISAGGQVEAVLGVKDLGAGKSLKEAFTGSINPSMFFELGGGIGVPYVFTVGASGKVEADMSFALDKDYKKVNVTGSANFKLKGPFGVPTYTKTFAKGSWLIYETGNPKALIKSANLYSFDELEDYDNPYLIDLDAPVTITEHSEEDSEWVGDVNVPELMSSEHSNQSVTVLEQKSYQDMEPVLAKFDDKNVIARLTDNKTRTGGDKTMLVYTVQGEDGKWSEQKAIKDDGFADNNPVMEDGYIAWQKATGHITEKTTMRDLGKVSEILLSKWNGTGFDEPVQVTNNSLLDQAPVLAVNDGKATVVWIENSEGDVTGVEGENKIMSYTDGEVKTETEVDGAVTYLSATYIDGKLNIAYEVDTDKDLSTLEDRQINIIKEGTSGVIAATTDENAIDTHPIYAKLNEKPVLFYHADDKIVYIEDGVEKTAVESDVDTDQFSVVSNGTKTSVIWTSVNNGAIEFRSASYNGSKWSKPVQISDLEARIKFPSAIMENDGSIFAAFNRTERVENDYYYDDGQSDLCTIKIVPSVDIEITDAYFDEAEMKAYATLTNIGEVDISSYNISFTGNNSKTITTPLKSGESVDVELEYNKPENMKKTYVEFNAVAENEKDISTNSIAFEIGHADLVVNNVSVNDEETAVSADVSNDGYENLNNVKVKLIDEDLKEVAAAEKTVDINVGEKKQVSFDIDKTQLHFMDDTKVMYVVVETENEEISIGNNDDYIVISSASGYPDYEIDVIDYTKVSDEYIINSAVTNNTNKDISCKMCSAVYSEDGTLKGVGVVNAVIGANDGIGVDIPVSCDIAETDVIRSFMWNDKMTALARIGEI